MVLAVLEAHCGVRLSGHDVYLNVAGGLRINEPAADLAAAAALVSSLANAPLPADAVYFGEVSLSGAVRPVAQAAARLKEAQEARLRPRRHPGSRARGGRQRPRRSQAVERLSTLVADIGAHRGTRPQQNEAARQPSGGQRLTAGWGRRHKTDDGAPASGYTAADGGWPSRPVL